MKALNTLDLHFINGKPDGMLMAKTFNWTGRVLVAPRTRIDEVLDLKEAKHTGIYILFGEQEDGAPLAYIGEAEKLDKRLAQHVTKKDWWTSSIILITATENGLDKAHVKYIEARLVQIAEKVGSVLDNGNKPEEPSLSDTDKIDMEEFLDTLLMVLQGLRIDMFLDKRRYKKELVETSTSLASPTFELCTPMHGIQATAILEDGEFIVQEGSFARAEWVGQPQWHINYQELHKRLVATGVLKLEGDRRVFKTNYAFSASTPAGAIVNGRSTCGPTAWKIKGTDKTFKEWEAEKLAAITASMILKLD